MSALLNHESEPWLQFLHPTEIVIDIDNSQMAIMTNTPKSGGTDYHGLFKAGMATQRFTQKVATLAVMLAMSDGPLPIGDIIAVGMLGVIAVYSWYDYFF